MMMTRQKDTQSNLFDSYSRIAIPLPWGPGDGGDDPAGDGGNPAAGAEPQDPGGPPAAAQILEQLTAMNSRLESMEAETKSLGNFRSQMMRKIAGPTGDGDPKPAGGNEKPKGVKATDDATRREIDAIRKELNSGKVDLAMTSALKSVQDKLVPGAVDLIDESIRPYLTVIDGEPMFKRGDEVSSIADVVKAKASNKLFQSASVKQPGKKEGSETDSRSPSQKEFDDLDFDKMTSEEFQKVRAQQKERHRRG